MSNQVSELQKGLIFHAPLDEVSMQSGPALTSGDLVLGRTYKIVTFNSDDNFAACGAPNNNIGTSFLCAGSATPNHWAHASILREQNYGYIDNISKTVGTQTACYNVLDRQGSGRRWLNNNNSSSTTIADDPRYDFGTGDFALIFSITPDNITDNGNYIILKYDGVGYAVDQQDAGIRILFRDATHIVNAVIANDILQVGIKTTCEIVFNRANNAVLYINGSTTPYATLDISTIEGTLSNSSAFIVGNSGAYNVGFNGQIHFVRAFNYALTPTQMANYSKPEYPIEWVDRGAGLIYTSDFSAGVDGWTGIRGTAAGNIDGIGGQDNNLRITQSTTGQVALVSPANITIGKRYKVSGYYYIQSSNTYIDGIKIYGDSYGINRNVLDTWTYFSQDFVALETSWYAFATDNGNTSISNATDVFYLRGITVYSTCILDLNAEGLARASDGSYDVGHWTDKTNSVTADISGATVVIPPVSNLRGTWFNGTTSDIVTSFVVPTGDITIAFTIYSINNTNTVPLGSTQLRMRLYNTGEILFGRTTNTDFVISSAGAQVINTNYNVCITSTAAGLTNIYLNNINVGSGTITVASGGVLYVGNPTDYVGLNHFNGKMSDIYIYNRICSSDEIKLLYDINQ